MHHSSFPRYEPQPLDDWETLGDAQLVAKLDTPSQVRLLAAQRSLLRRPLSPELLQALLEMIHDKGVDLRVRVGALYALTQRGVHGMVSSVLLNQLKPLISVPELAPFVVRALGDMGIDQVTHKGLALFRRNGLKPSSANPALGWKPLGAARRVGRRSHR